MPPLLEAKNLRKVYTSGGGLFNRDVDENVALDDFSFEISGDKPVFISIAGESGSGKTTLAQLLLGFNKPTAGQVLFNGQDITRLSSQQMRSSALRYRQYFKTRFAVYNPFYKVDHILNIPIQKFKLASNKAEAHDKILESPASRRFASRRHPRTLSASAFRWAASTHYCCAYFVDETQTGHRRRTCFDG